MTLPTDRALRRLIWAAAAVAVLLRLVFGFGVLGGRLTTGDEREYLSMARGLASGQGAVYVGGFLPDQTHPFSRPPGYPALLALFGAGAADPTYVPVQVVVAQSIAGAIGVLLIAAVTRRALGPLPSVLAAWLAACYPPLVWTASYALTESIYWPVALAIVWFFDRAVESVSSSGTTLRWAAMCGLAVGAATLIRPGTVFVLPLAVAWLAWRRRPAALAALALGTVLVVLPWTARNYVRFHRVILVAASGGVTFWTGNQAAATGDGDAFANRRIHDELRNFRDAHPGLTEEELDPLFTAAAWQWIRSDPSAAIWLQVRKAFFLVVPAGPSYTQHTQRIREIAAIGSYVIVLPFALAGVFRMGPRRAQLPGLWLMVAAAVLQCLVFFPQERYRYAVIDPALLICVSGLMLTSASGRGTPQAD